MSYSERHSIPSGCATRPLLYAVFSAVLGMFQFGFNTGIIIPELYSGTIFDITFSIYAIGGMVGCLLASWVVEKRGRKFALLANAVFGVLAATFSKVALSVSMLIAGRFLIGINCGFATSASPTYVSEIAPVRLRGALGTVNQLAVAFGLVASQTLSTDFILGSDEGWYWLLGLAVVPSAVQCVMIPFAPESPRYLLLVKRDEAQTRSILTKIRGTAEIDDEIKDMYVEDDAEKQEEEFTVLDLFRIKSLRTPIFIGVGLHLTQQFSGINVILYCLTAGFFHKNVGLVSFGVSSVLFIMALVSIPLIDRLGRRTLQLCGLLGMTVCSALMSLLLLISLFFIFHPSKTISLFAVLFMSLYVLFFGVGPSSIPWIILPELFGQRARSAAVSIGALVNWFGNLIVGVTSIPLFNWLGIFGIVLHTVLLLIFFLLTYFHLPETKNKKIQEVTALFRK